MTFGRDRKTDADGDGSRPCVRTRRGRCVCASRNWSATSWRPRHRGAIDVLKPGMNFALRNSASSASRNASPEYRKNVGLSGSRGSRSCRAPAELCARCYDHKAGGLTPVVESISSSSAGRQTRRPQDESAWRQTQGVGCCGRGANAFRKRAFPPTRIFHR